MPNSIDILHNENETGISWTQEIDLCFQWHKKSLCNYHGTNWDSK